MSESVQQSLFFRMLAEAAPKPPAQHRRISKGKNKGESEYVDLLLDEKFITHELYVLTRVRHIFNEGKRNPGKARALGIKAGAFDISLDAARIVQNHQYYGFRLEFKDQDDYKISCAQKAERLWLDRENYFGHYVWHSLEGIALLALYLNIEPARLGFPRRQFALPLDYLPEKFHDEKCGCNLKLSEIIRLR